MNTEIYYFSGTGNSLFLARELQKRIPDSEVIPIAGLLRNGKIKCEGKIIGIVFPVHALTIPVAVKRFLEKADLSGAQYIFSIADRLGTVFHGFKKIDRLLKKKKKRLDAEFVIDMCNNEARHELYNVPSEDEIYAYERNALEILDAAARIILDNASHKEDIRNHKVKSGSNAISAFLTDRLVLTMMDFVEHTKGVNYFYHDEKCTGCGTCEKVCLSDKISLSGGKPVWDRNTFCYMCFACLNFCPVKAVQIQDIPGVKSHSKENGRYPHPYASIADMEKQKGNQI